MRDREREIILCLLYWKPQRERQRQEPDHALSSHIKPVRAMPSGRLQKTWGDRGGIEIACPNVN